LARSEELEWLADHHLDLRAFFGDRGIDPHDEAARPGADAEAEPPSGSSSTTSSQISPPMWRRWW
jgi:hypothetical protein